MSQSKKELVLAALDRQPVERVPSGFWFHFLPDEIHADALKEPELARDLLRKEESYIEGARPDFVKIMTDGFFPYPNEKVLRARSLKDFKDLQPLPDDHPFFTEQIAYARALTERYGHELALFYNVFCAGTTLKFMQPRFEEGEPFLLSLLREDKEELRRVLDIISEDLAKLARRVITEGGVTGIYFSLQNLIGEGVTKEIYDEVLAPGEKKILAAANSVSAYNILHICGYAGHRNVLSWYADYEAKAVNWAAVVEGVSLGEGQKIFEGKAVLGGFGNLQTDVLYSGSRQEIQDETRRLLEEAGRTGVLLGADCTVPRDTDWEHFEWVREAAV